MAALDIPGVEVEWCDDGEYTLPDSSDMLKFNLNIVDPVAFVGWYAKTEWPKLTWYGRAISLLAWAIVSWKYLIWPIFTSRST